MNIGIIGVGRMGQRHIEAAIANGFNIVSIFDTNIDLIQKVATTFNLNKAVSNTAEIFFRNKLDLIIIATTADGHDMYLKKSIVSGAEFILVEKPFVTSLESGYLIRDLAAKKRVKIAVNHGMIFTDIVKLLKQLISGPLLGPVICMSFHTGKSGLVMNGSHFIHLFNYFTGAAPVKVSALFDADSSINPRGANFRDISGFINVYNEQNQRLYISSPAQVGHGMTCIIQCEFGYIDVDFISGKIQGCYRSLEHKSAPKSRYGLPSISFSYQCNPDQLVYSSAIMQSNLVNNSEIVNVDDAISVIEVLVGAYESNDNLGIFIDLDAIKFNNKNFPWA